MVLKSEETVFQRSNSSFICLEETQINRFHKLAFLVIDFERHPFFLMFIFLVFDELVKSGIECNIFIGY